MVFPFARIIAFPIFRLFVHKSVGMHNLPSHGPFIIAIKHVGSLDGFFVASEVIPYLNRHIYFFANNLRWGWFWERIVSERWAKTHPFYEKKGV